MVSKLGRLIVDIRYSLAVTDLNLIAREGWPIRSGCEGVTCGWCSAAPAVRGVFRRAGYPAAEEDLSAHSENSGSAGTAWLLLPFAVWRTRLVTYSCSPWKPGHRAGFFLPGPGRLRA